MKLLTFVLVLASALPANASTAWPSGDFALRRTEVHVPGGDAQIYWRCNFGTMSVSERVVAFAPGITFDEVAIHTSSWLDPPNDWNSTINANVTQIWQSYSASGNGFFCGCDYFQLTFGESMVQIQKNSSIAIDFFQVPFGLPPFNWYDADDLRHASNIQNVNHSPGASFSTQGWTQPYLLSQFMTFKTNNKFLRIDKSSEPIVLRAMSTKAYGISVYLIRENPNPKLDLFVRDRPVNSMDLFTSETSDFGQATAMTFAPAPDGHYYSITINNEIVGEDVVIVDFQPPVTCQYTEYGLETGADVMYSLQTCKDVACGGETIVVVPDDSSTSKPSKANALFGVHLWMTSLVILAHAVSL